jgi:tRNA-2-methylthio-N6-dimethylallyladenosine synthase
MKGCDHFCSYCIVPYTRGREKSRPMADVVADVERLVGQGVKEITFLGQNINTYGKRSADGDSLHKLFREVHGIDGLERIRFTTSHPGDLKDELIQCFADLPKLCSQFHLPVQSGSDRVLRGMRRCYTRAQYLERVRLLRQARPDLAFSTDIIAGFPGETEEEVEMTISLLEEVRYDNVYSFIFSPRPGTSAAARADTLAEDEKVRRLMKIQAVARRISRELHEAEAGHVRRILIEGPSKKDPAKLTGRTSQGVSTHVDASHGYKAGDLVDVLITAGTQTHLKAKPAFATDQKRKLIPVENATY